MKWLVYTPLHTVPEAYPRYRKSEFAPVHEWHEYRSHINEKGTERFWSFNSKIDPVMGTYGCYPIRLLKADFTFGWDIDDFGSYNGIIVTGGVDATVYLRKKVKYEGTIITYPRLPRGLRYPKEVIDCSDLILLNHEPEIETAENLNRVNNTDKFFLFVLPTVNVDFLTKNFYKHMEEKERRIITYHVSSGPQRADTSKVGGSMRTLKRLRTKVFRRSKKLQSVYLRTVHGLAKGIEERAMSDRIITLRKTAGYLREFQKNHPEVDGFMTKALNDAPEPFVGLDIKYADDYYRFIADSYLIILASATYASMTLYGACVGTPSVGSQNTTMQKLLFPGLSFDEDDVDSLVSAMIRLFEDKDFYVSQQKQGLKNVDKWFSDDRLRTRFYATIRRLLSA